ncbi:MAG: RimK family alpha-L-glutamate ligase [Myxococcaceae bacterium]
MSATVVLATCKPLPNYDPEHAPIIEALGRRGVSCEAVAWDARVSWTGAEVVVLRSTWDYHLRREEFLSWVERTALLTSVWNPAKVVRWNSHKGYLRELSERGVPTVPTEWVPKGKTPSLSELLTRRGWTDAVAKPAISAGGFETVRVRHTADAQAAFERIAAHSEVMVQPYLRSVEGHGERSLVYIGGEFSHAVRKPPLLKAVERPSDDVVPAIAEADELELAKRVLAAVESELLYARVDLARDESGRPMLMELEVIEPSLFLRHAKGAADRLAEAIIQKF